MSLLLAALTPHLPILHDGIRESEENPLKDTVIAMKKIAQECYTAKIKTVVIIAPHEEQYEDTFGIIGTPSVTSSYLEFGDGVSEETYPINIKLTSHIIEECKKNDVPISTIPLSRIHYGTAIPLIPIKKVNKQLSVVIISPPKKGSFDQLLKFGYLLKEVLLLNNDRTIIIASGETTHTNEKDGLLPFHKGASIAQQKLISAIEELDPAHLYHIEYNQIDELGMCVAKPAAVLLGCLKNTAPIIERLSFEKYEGVGLATILYALNRHTL